jgi:uncharacterized protein YegL
MNFPAHLREEPLDSVFANTDPVIIHYHWLVDERGLIEPSPYPNVNRRIQQFNDRLLKEQCLRTSATAPVVTFGISRIIG